MSMSIDSAVVRLRAKLRRAAWLTTIGVGKERGADVIFLYVKAVTAETRALERGWCGFPVVVRKMQQPRLLRQRALA